MPVNQNKVEKFLQEIRGEKEIGVSLPYSLLYSLIQGGEDP